MELRKLSASRIKTYKNCEFKYFLDYHLKLPEMRTTNIYAIKGTCVHEALEFYARYKMGEKENAEEDYEATLLNFYKENKLWHLDDRLPDKYGNPKGWPHPVEKTCESCLWATKDDKCRIAGTPIALVKGCPRPNFEDDLELTKRTVENESYDIFNRKILGVEKKFVEDLGDGLIVRGVIDLVTEINKDTIEIIDHKSGRSISYNAMRKDPQSRTYSLVARRLWPQYKYVQMTLYFLRKTPVTCIFTKEDDDLTLQSLHVNWDAIKNNENPIRPNYSFWLCNFCIGHDRCGEIREVFKTNGQFKLPIIRCEFHGQAPCWGNVISMPQLKYSCEAHWELHKGGEYVPKPNDGDTDA